MMQSALLIAVLLANPEDEIDLAGATIVVESGDETEALEPFAARELSRYLRLLCGQESPVVEERKEGRATIGAEPRRADGARGPLVRPSRPPAARAGSTVIRVGIGALSRAGIDPESLDEQACVLRVVHDPEGAKPGPGLVVSGRTPAGVMYAAYGLLEKLGVGFYLGGDALPERRDRLGVPRDLDEVRTPVFKIRGSLPWYNFLNSPTTWDLEDFQVFFDQMAKMRCNFVGFHSYDSEPFCAYPWEGSWRMGAPAATSLTYGWGTVRPLGTDDFGFGTGRYFPHAVFGSRSAALARDPPERLKVAAQAARIFPFRNASDDAILRAQCSLAQGLEYGRRRGVKVCLGFELTGDPTEVESRRQAEARIRNLLASYPMLDYVWFWQSEGLGGGSQAPRPDAPLDLIVQRLRPTFEYLGNESRIAEAARVAAWVDFAYGVVRRFRPDIRVIVSGWGGDAWMRFSDFYVGLDAVLPGDIIFAALDNIDPSAQDHVSEAYGKLSPQREKWPIPWFESDGGGTRRDQWGPQANVKPFTALVRDAARKGCQGLLSIHWQTRGVEEVAAWSAQFSWDPDLSYEAFYDRFARSCFGDRHGPEMAKLLARLESLGPRWTGGSGQVECGGFQWFSDDRRPRDENYRALEEIDGALERMEADLRQGPGLRHLERLRYLRATIAFQTSFDRAALDLAPGGRIAKMLDDAETANAAGRAEEAERLAAEAIDALSTTTLRDAMEAYAERLTSQGDFGNLATINVKAYAAYLGLLERAAAVAAKEPTPPPGRGPAPGAGPTLVVKLPPSALPEGVPFPVHAIAFSGDAPAAAVTAYYRQAVSMGPEKVREWTAIRMGPGGRNLFSSSLPVGPEGIEFWIEARDAAGLRTFAPVGYPEIVYSASALPVPAAIQGPFLHGEMALVPPGTTGDAAPRVVRATILSQIEYERFRVVAEVGGKKTAGWSLYHLASPPLPEGAGGEAELPVALSARTDADGKEGAALRTEARLRRPGAPVSPEAVRAEIAGPFLVRVSWKDFPRSDFEVHRSSSPGFAPSDTTLLARWPWTTYDDARVKPGARYEYAVVAVGDSGLRSAPARSPVLEVEDFPLLPAPEGVAARPGFGRITLSWKRSPHAAAGHAVFLQDGPEWKRVSGEQPLAGPHFVLGGLADTAERRFVVRTVDRAGRPGEPSAEVAAAPLEAPMGPVLEATFEGTKARTGQEGRLGGKAKVEGGVLDVREGGWIAFAGEEMLQLAGPITVELWANVDRIEGIPVLISFGHWEGPGYWIQLIGGGIRSYLAVQKILDAGALPTGGWHHLASTYDGSTSRIFVDGKEVGAREVGQVDLSPWPGELRVGIYSDLDAQFQTLGRLDDVRIWQRALSNEEVLAGFERGRSTP